MVDDPPVPLITFESISFRWSTMRNDLRQLMKTVGYLAGSIWELVGDGVLEWAYAIARYEAASSKSSQSF